MAEGRIYIQNPQEAKRFGRYYTPESVAQAIVDWAIQDSTATVLDPSFGGCSFFRASVNTLKRYGAREPGRLLHGVDIDPDARSYLSPLMSSGASSNQFLTADFLTIQPKRMNHAPYKAVVGNPPYVRHHDLQHKFDIRRTLGLNNGAGLSAKASYWAYFVLHSLKFVAPAGRIAMVLPSAFLHADYAEMVREEVLKSFSRLVIVLIRERLFDNAEENSLLVLGEGRGQPNRELRLGVADSAGDVASVCNALEDRTRVVSLAEQGNPLLSALISKAARGLIQELGSDPRIVTLSQLASVRIGTVTGANGFFIMSNSERRRLAVSRHHVRPIVKRASHLLGLSFRRSDHKRLVQEEQPAFLLALTEDMELPVELRSYIGQAKKSGIHKGYKCGARSTWYCLGRPRIPDAFLQYMSASMPRVVLNGAAVACTNAIHELSWERKLSACERRYVAMASLSTLFQLSAELEGRSYGGGVLKLEPSEAMNLLLVSPSCGAVKAAAYYSKTDTLIRSGQKEAGAQLMDRVLLKKTLGLSEAEVSELVEACDSLRQIRLPRA